MADDMSILELIKQDHERTQKALESIKNTSTRTTGTRDRPWKAMKSDLNAHMIGEENVFYPALEAVMKDEILVAVEEHNLIKTMLQQMNDLPKDEDFWTAKLKVLMENVRQHIQDEEARIFKAATGEFSKEQLLDMGRRFEEAKELVLREE